MAEIVVRFWAFLFTNCIVIPKDSMGVKGFEYQR